ICRALLKGVELDAEANLRSARLEFCRIAKPRYRGAAQDDRMRNNVGKHCIGAAAREDVERQHDASGIFGARKSEKVGDVGGRIAQLSWPIEMIGHRQTPLLSRRTAPSTGRDRHQFMPQVRAFIASAEGWWPAARRTV